MNPTPLEARSTENPQHPKQGQPALDARFEVHFMGAEACIDMRPSTDWLRAKTAAWK